jgi:hypothetical protein
MEINSKKLKEVEKKSDMVIENPTAKQILKYLARSDRISYIGVDNKYRSGGFIMNIAEDGSSVSISGGNLRWSVKTENLDTLFIVKRNNEDE